MTHFWWTTCSCTPRTVETLHKKLSFRREITRCAIMRSPARACDEHYRAPHKLELGGISDIFGQINHQLASYLSSAISVCYVIKSEHLISAISRTVPRPACPSATLQRFPRHDSRDLDARAPDLVVRIARANAAAAGGRDAGRGTARVNPCNV